MISQWLDHRRTQRSAYELVTGELTDERLLRHAERCPVCTATLADMREAIDLTSCLKNPLEQRPQQYWQTFGLRVFEQIKLEDRRRIRSVSVSPKYAFFAGVATAASLIAVAVLLWRSASPGSGVPNIPAEPSAVSVRDRTFDYFERSRVILVGVLNAEPQDLGKTPELLRRQGAASRALVEEGRELDRQLTEPGDARLRQLVNELEVILVQLANLEEGQDLPGLEIIREGVDRRGVLLKITIEEMSRHAPIPGPPPTATNERISRSL